MTDEEATMELPTPHGKVEVFPYVYADIDLLRLPIKTLSMIKDNLMARKKYGIKTYGEPLKTFNGRSVEIDTKQEALDTAMYIKQGIMEGLPWSDAYSLMMCVITELYREE